MALRVWRKIDALGEPEFSRNKHTAVIHGHRMLMFGGYSLQKREFFNDVTAFDFRKMAWEELKTSGCAPSKRRAHTCVVLDNMLVVFGGYNGDYCLSDTFTFDLMTNTWTKRECVGEIPPSRGGHTAVVWSDRRMVVHGGWDVGNLYYDCTYVLHTCAPVWRWQRLPVASVFRPVGRVGHTCVLHEGHKMLVFGGYGGEGYWDDLNQLNLLTGEWEVVNVNGDIKPCHRTFSTMEIVDNRILLFGGSNHALEMNDVYIFDTKTATWEEVDCLGQVPDGRFAHISCLYNHKIYLYGGIVRSAGELNGMYELTLEQFTTNGSLSNLVQQWIVQSRLAYGQLAPALPAAVAARLDDYRTQVQQMAELRAAAAAVPSPPPLPATALATEFDDSEDLMSDEEFFDDGDDSDLWASPQTNATTSPLHVDVPNQHVPATASTFGGNTEPPPPCPTIDSYAGFVVFSDCESDAPMEEDEIWLDEDSDWGDTAQPAPVTSLATSPFATPHPSVVAPDAMTSEGFVVAPATQPPPAVTTFEEEKKNEHPPVNTTMAPTV
eukprot:TRINITY_DN4727_c0_g1_i1.p1 TRINITY_DN4727_c0_g1~~TRINITY_DN4727_c0_g1_i1.p1  ORF type:complete len:549 (+),score=110.10 TRINITY_DN4727_c0_g1_i1:60-1706(+)